ncbi:MAG TPA: penicillin-binding transpeptidase domain-containing protein [Propionibacteriaceae bacterium]|nr:penicillin-binding transpeptidase domain-containing protein [Propionibacteriaceae bacterium]
MSGHYAARWRRTDNGAARFDSLLVLLALARRQDGPVRFRAVAIVLTSVVSLVGCTSSGSGPTPPPAEDSAARAAADLANGLAKKDVSAVEFASADSAAVNHELQDLLTGMGPLAPNVQVGSVKVEDETATAALRINWTFPGVSTPWTYETSARLVTEAGRWKPSWQPSLVQPDLDGSNRLSQHRLYPERGEVRGDGGIPIVSLRAVVRLGIDKARVNDEQAATSAARLARLLRIDSASYTSKVRSAGSDAFVEAIVLRRKGNDVPSETKVAAIPGALAIEDQRMLAPNRNFARPILGTVGEATKEMVDASNGAVVGGDQVGLFGLQRRYDEQLRGTPGVRVQLAPAKAAGSASPSPSSSPVETPASDPRTVFEVKPVAGKPLDITLLPSLQRLAEKTLADTKPASALVAIRPSDGAVLAAANGAGTKGQSAATVGQFAPGSTFKVVSALALLRAGLKPTSTVSCPATVTVDGRKFRNYSDYPRNDLGSISFRTALAQSCNTAFIGQRSKLNDNDLAAAAASLGVGVDYDVGFPSFFGSVPADKAATGRAAAMIGQGKVEASPLAMASVVASVAAGKSVLPHLVSGQQATSEAQPLESGEADQLRSMMRSVVTDGSGRVLLSQDGPPIIAKTGTAEYGSSKPLKTHVWMIAAQGDLAVAVFVNDGKSGSQTAGPLLAEFLAGVR